MKKWGASVTATENLNENLIKACKLELLRRKEIK